MFGEREFASQLFDFCFPGGGVPQSGPLCFEFGCVILFEGGYTDGEGVPEYMGRLAIALKQPRAAPFAKAALLPLALL